MTLSTAREGTIEGASGDALQPWGDAGGRLAGNAPTSCAKARILLRAPRMVVVVGLALLTSLVVAASASASGSAAAWGWGYNPNGELGNGTTTNSDLPVAVSLPPGVTVKAVAAGYTHSLAVLS